MKSKQENENTIFTNEEFLTRRESARFLRLSLAKFDKIKDIDCIRYGKSKRFSISVLRNYAQKNTVGGNHDA